MSKFRIKAIAVCSALTMIAPVTFGATVEELQAQISALLAQIQTLQSQLAAVGGTQTTPTFTRDLTVGSRGDDVTALQNLLISANKGPAAQALAAAGATGYFGQLTKAALAEYQAAVNISPAAGYFGPITRAYVNSLAAAPATGTGTTTPTTPTTPTVQVSTPGVEAVLSAEWAPSPASGVSVEAGDTDAAIVGVRVKAKQGDAIVQRLTLKFESTNPFHKVFSKLALYDGSTELAEITNLPSAYVKNGTGDYRITFSGFNVLVSKDSYKDLTVKGTLNGSIGDAYITNYNVWVPADGVRAIDGANINQYAGITGLRSFKVDQSESERATLSLSKDASSPKAGILVADSNGKVEKGTMLVLALSAEEGRVKVTDITVDTSTTTPAADFSALYLYDGDNLISSVSAADNSSSTFNDLEIYVDKDTTKLLTIKADFVNADARFSTSTISVATSSIAAERTDGTSLNVDGSAAESDVMRITTVAPVPSFVSATTKYGRPNSQEATGTIEATFVFDLTAKGKDIFVKANPAGVAHYSFGLIGNNASTTPDTINVSADSTAKLEGGAYRIAKGQTARFTIEVAKTLNLSSANYWGQYCYFVLEGFDWGTAADLTGGDAINFLDTSVWRSNAVLVN